jgi:hypothetical protein
LSVFDLVDQGAQAFPDFRDAHAARSFFHQRECTTKCTEVKRVNYLVVHDGLGRAEIVGPINPGLPATSVGARRRRVPFTAEHSRQLGGLFNDVIKQWKAAQRKWKKSFSFRAFLLGTLSASEYNDGSDQLKAAVQHTALNWERGNRWGWTLEKMLIPDGRFGQQSGRYASTSKAATLRDVEIAEKVLAGRFSDPTEGAIQFDAPRTQKILSKLKPEQYKTPEKVAKERQDAGLRPVFLAKEDPELARFWRPTYVAQL